MSASPPQVKSFKSWRMKKSNVESWKKKPISGILWLDPRNPRVFLLNSPYPPCQVEFNQGEIVEHEPASTWVDLTFNLGCAATVSLGRPRSNLTKVRL
jgi:hypothetical protein